MRGRARLPQGYGDQPAPPAPGLTEETTTMTTALDTRTPTRIDRLVAASTGVAGPTLLLASTLAYLAHGDLNRGQAAGALEIWAAAFYAVAIVGLARLLSAASPVTAGVVTVLGVTGGMGMAAYGMDAIQRDLFGTSIVGSAATPFALRIPGLFFPLALLVLGLGLARHRLVPAGAAYALAAAAVLFPLSRISNIIPIALASDAIGLAAMVVLSRQLVRSAGADRG